MTSAEILQKPADARRWTRHRQELGRRVALVPTMGALHAGHLSLIDRARVVADHVIVSIFVNPTQFNRTEDFDTYPRTTDEDLSICASHGVDAVYLPTVQTMYPEGHQTRIEPGALALQWEGAHRPGHFAGVATVVAKLLNACVPDVAVFGAKDRQQLAVIRRTVLDLDLGVDILAAPTLREDDGLAMSSRNRRLDPASRSAAAAISRGLDEARAMASRSDKPTEIARAAREIISEEADEIDYVAVVDIDTFDTPDVVVDPPRCALIVAAWFGGVRLIDNILLAGDD